MSRNNKIYCGINQLPKKSRYGNPLECANLGEVSRYGIRKISQKNADIALSKQQKINKLNEDYDYDYEDGLSQLSSSDRKKYIKSLEDHRYTKEYKKQPNLSKGLNINVVEEMKNELEDLIYQYEQLLDEGYEKEELKDLEDDIYELEDKIKEHEEDYSSENDDDIDYLKNIYKNFKLTAKTAKDKRELKKIENRIKELEKNKITQEYDELDYRGYGY